LAKEREFVEKKEKSDGRIRSEPDIDCGKGRSEREREETNTHLGEMGRLVGAGTCGGRVCGQIHTQNGRCITKEENFPEFFVHFFKFFYFSQQQKQSKMKKKMENKQERGKRMTIYTR